MAKKAIAALAGTVTVSILSVDYVSGPTVIAEDGTVTTTYKVPRSSKHRVAVYAPGQYLTATAGEDGGVSFMGQNEVLSIEVDDIAAGELVDGLLTLTDSDGVEHVIDTRVSGLLVEREAPAEAPAAAAPAKAKAKAAEEAPAKAKGKGKAKEEPEAEEEEEDEAPAKAGKGKAKDKGEKAAKGKGKAKDEDWE